MYYKRKSYVYHRMEFVVRDGKIEEIYELELFRKSKKNTIVP